MSGPLLALTGACIAWLTAAGAFLLWAIRLGARCSCPCHDLDDELVDLVDLDRRLS